MFLFYVNLHTSASPDGEETGGSLIKGSTAGGSGGS